MIFSIYEVAMTIDPKTGLYFESSGPESAPTIVFLHGGGIGGWMWRKQVEALNTEFHCLVPDLPEQGESTGVGPFSVEFAADCVAELIKSHAHGGKAHVVGLSEGAQIVVALLSRAPEVIESAFSSSAILRPLPGQWMYSRGLFSISYRWFMAPYKNNDWWIRLNMHGSAGIGDEYYTEFKKSFQETTDSGFTNLMYSAMHFKMPEGLEKANVPVLVVVGKLEYKQMQQSARDLLSVLPNARGVMVSLGQGSSLAKEHNWALSLPDLFTQTVRAWVNHKPLPEQLLPFEA